MKLKLKLKTAKGALNRALWWALLALPATSHAASIQSIVDKTIRYLNGSLARSVGVLVLIGAGYMCLFQHKFPKEILGYMLLGLGIIFGGAQLYDLLIG